MSFWTGTSERASRAVGLAARAASGVSSKAIGAMICGSERASGDMQSAPIEQRQYDGCASDVIDSRPPAGHQNGREAWSLGAASVKLSPGRFAGQRQRIPTE